MNPKHAKLDQKSWFGHVRTCQVVICTCPDLPRPVQEDKYLLQTSGNTFIFSDFTPFHFLLANLSFFIKSCVFISKFIIFYKIRNSVSGPPKIFLIGSTRGVIYIYTYRRRCLKFTLPLYPMIPPTARTCPNEGF